MSPSAGPIQDQSEIVAVAISRLRPRQLSNPGDVDYVATAVVMIIQRRFDHAVDALSAAAEEATRGGDADPQLFVLLSSCCYQLGQFAAARCHAERVIQLDQNERVGYILLWQSSLAMGQWADATRACEDGQRWFPGDENLIRCEEVARATEAANSPPTQEPFQPPLPPGSPPPLPPGSPPPPLPPGSPPPLPLGPPPPLPPSEYATETASSFAGYWMVNPSPSFAFQPPESLAPTPTTLHAGASPFRPATPGPATSTSPSPPPPSPPLPSTEPPPPPRDDDESADQDVINRPPLQGPTARFISALQDYRERAQTAAAEGDMTAAITWLTLALTNVDASDTPSLCAHLHQQRAAYRIETREFELAIHDADIAIGLRAGRCLKSSRAKIEALIQLGRNEEATAEWRRALVQVPTSAELRAMTTRIMALNAPPSTMAPPPVATISRPTLSSQASTAQRDDAARRDVIDSSARDSSHCQPSTPPPPTPSTPPPPPTPPPPSPPPSSLSSEAPLDATGYLSIINKLAEEGNLQEAIETCTAALADATVDATAHYRILVARANFRHELKQFEEAIADADAAAQGRPKACGTAYRLKCRALLGLNRRVDALTIWKAVFGLGVDHLDEAAFEIDFERPGSPTEAYELALSYVYGRNFGNAIKQIKVVQAQADRVDPGLVALRARCFLGQHQYANAITEANAAIKFMPTAIVAHRCVCEAHVMMGNLAEARTACARARTVFPDDPGFQALMVSLDRLDVVRDEDEIAAYMPLEATNPLTEAATALGDAGCIECAQSARRCFDRDDFASAVEWATQALAFARAAGPPELTTAMLLIRAASALALGRPPVVIKDTEQILRRTGGCMWAYALRCEAQLASGDEDAAIVTWAEGCKRCRTSAVLRRLEAKYPDVQWGRPTSSPAPLKETRAVSVAGTSKQEAASSTATTDPMPLATAQQLIGRRDFGNAIFWVNKAVQAETQVSQRASLLALRGRCRFELKQYTGVIKDTDAALAIDSTCWEGHYWACKAKAALGLISQAQDLCTWALKKNPTDAQLLGLQAELAVAVRSDYSPPPKIVPRKSYSRSGSFSAPNAPTTEETTAPTSTKGSSDDLDWRRPRELATRATEIPEPRASSPSVKSDPGGAIVNVSDEPTATTTALAQVWKLHQQGDNSRALATLEGHLAEMTSDPSPEMLYLHAACKLPLLQYSPTERIEAFEEYVAAASVKDEWMARALFSMGFLYLTSRNLKLATQYHALAVAVEKRYANSPVDEETFAPKRLLLRAMHPPLLVVSSEDQEAYVQEGKVPCRRCRAMEIPVLEFIAHRQQCEK